MKKTAKSAVLALALALSLSVGVGTTANAAKVNVKKVVTYDQLTANKKSATLTKGKKATLKTVVTVNPSTTANKKVTYKSSNTKVATVKAKGSDKAIITAKKVGTATITVKSAKNTKKKVTFKVKVVAGKVKKVAVTSETNLSLKVNETSEVKTKVTTSGKNANKKLAWGSTDETVATVDKNGVITAVSDGTAIISATSTDGTKKTAKVTVTVKGVKVSLVESADAEAEVTFTKAADFQSDVDALVKALGYEANKEIDVTIDGVAKKAVYNGTNVTVNGKKLAEVKPDATSIKVKVKLTGKVSNAVALTSVSSVKIKDVTISDITAETFKIGEDVYDYVVEADGTVTVKNAELKDLDALANTGLFKTEDK